MKLMLVVRKGVFFFYPIYPFSYGIEYYLDHVKKFRWSSPIEYPQLRPSTLNLCSYVKKLNFWIYVLLEHSLLLCQTALKTAAVDPCSDKLKVHFILGRKINVSMTYFGQEHLLFPRLLICVFAFIDLFSYCK